MPFDIKALTNQVIDKAKTTAKKSYSDYKEKQENIKAEAELRRIENEKRRNSILAGNIPPLTNIIVNLEPGEKAYMLLNAQRKALVEYVTERTVNTSKRSGTLTRAVVGGVLLGPLGAVAGAVTAGSKGSSSVYRETNKKEDVIDSGSLYFTNKRILFIGSRNAVSLPYKELIAVQFGPSNSFIKLSYKDMLEGERYYLSGYGVAESDLFYRGITNNLLS